MDPRDIGSHIYAAGGVGARGVAAGTGDNTEVTSGVIDRQAVGKNALSCLVVFSGSATLAENETLQVAFNLQESSDNAAADAYADVTAATVAATTVLTGVNGGAKQNFTYQKKFDLTLLERYLKLQFTPNCSASGTDTFEMSAVVILGGFAENPVQ